VGYTKLARAGELSNPDVRVGGAFRILFRRIAWHPVQRVGRTLRTGPEIANDAGLHVSRQAIFDAGVEYGTVDAVETARKITVEVPAELLEKAQRASGTGITQTVRTGLQLVAASQTYAQLRQLRGKVRFSRTLAELKADR